VTGTKGKGTVSALIYEILKKAGKKVWLGGNIGIAPFEFLDKIKKDDWVVLELSSFQLEDIEVSPKIAVITNFYKEHLSSADPNNPNYHRSMKRYWNAKMNIVKWQKRGDKVVINKKLEIRNLKFGRGKKIFFTKLELPSKLIGEHNKENIAAAVEVAKIIGIKKDIIKKAVKQFKGLEHRLELVKTIRGIKYYNDSFATTPESVITALNSFKEPIILLAGGAEKKSDFKKLARVIKKKVHPVKPNEAGAKQFNRVKFVVLLNGEATLRLKKELIQSGFFGKNIKLVYNMIEAVRVARKNASSGNIILLSPACASFGMFKNYKERGNLFKKEVEKIK
jgi:UDP-N-acetylmuramoylalanine--D-glutamate ligase